MAYSLILGTLAGSFINAFPNKKLLNYSWAEQMKDILPNIVLACAMSVPVYFLGNLPFPTIIVLGIQVLTGAGTYIGLSLILQIKSFVKLWNWVKDILRKKM